MTAVDADPSLSGTGRPLRLNGRATWSALRMLLVSLASVRSHFLILESTLETANNFTFSLGGIV